MIQPTSRTFGLGLIACGISYALAGWIGVVCAIISQIALITDIIWREEAELKKREEQG